MKIHIFVFIFYTRVIYANTIEIVKSIDQVDLMIFKVNVENILDDGKSDCLSKTISVNGDVLATEKIDCMKKIKINRLETFKYYSLALQKVLMTYCEIIDDNESISKETQLIKKHALYDLSSFNACFFLINEDIHYILSSVKNNILTNLRSTRTLKLQSIKNFSIKYWNGLLIIGYMNKNDHLRIEIANYQTMEIVTAFESKVNGIIKTVSIFADAENLNIALVETNDDGSENLKFKVFSWNTLKLKFRNSTNAISKE